MEISVQVSQNTKKTELLPDLEITFLGIQWKGRLIERDYTVDLHITELFTQEIELA